MAQDPIILRLRWLFGCCLFFIAIFVISFCWLLNSSIHSNKDYASLINKSGRQRMLSQRVTLLASELATAFKNDKPNLLKIRTELLQAKQEFEEAHLYLVQQELKKGEKSSFSLRKLYFSPEKGLEKQIQTFLHELDDFTAIPNEKLSQEDSHLKKIIKISNKDELLGTLNSIVLQYQEESNQKTHETQILNCALAFILFSALIALLGFVFKYLEKTGLRYISQLNTVNISLTLENDKRKSLEEDLRQQITTITQNAEEKEAFEKHIEEEQQRFLLTVEGSRDAIWDWNTITNDVYYSPRFSEILGYEIDQIEHKLDEFSIRLHPADKALVWSSLQAHFEDRTPYEIEYRLQNKSGDYLWISAKGQAVYDDSGKPIRMVGSLGDINKRKLLEQTLIANEAQWRSAMENAPIGQALVSTSGHFLYVNPALCTIVGYPTEELLALDFQQITHPDDLGKDVALLEKLLSGDHQHYEMEKRYIHKKGHYVTIQLNVSLIRDTAGNPLHFISQIQNITERKQAQEFLEILFKYSSDAYLIVSEEGTIDCNEATVRMLNCTDKKQVLETHPIHLSPEFQPDGRNSLEKGLAMQTIAYQNGYHRFDWVHRKLTGEELPVEVSLTAATFSNRRSLLVIWHDLTERKKMEEALRASEESIRRTMEFAAIGMALVTPDGHWFQINNALCQMLGYSREELTTLDVQSITHPDDLEMDMEQAKLLLKGDIDTYQMEKRFVSHSGRIVWAQINVALVHDAKDQPFYFVKQIQDITQRRQMELDLRQALIAADQANHFKSEFLANMSHEIRTPMNGILGMAEIALGTELTATQRGYLEIVYSSGKSLLTIINDILDFSKIEAGKLTLDPTPFKLRESLSEMMHLFSKAVDDKGIELIYAVQGNVPNVITADPTRIRQIMTNLIGNAIKFTSKGEVFFGLEVQKEMGNHFVLHGWVKDSGIGMSEEQQKKVFQPFTQAESSTTRHFGGTGLGLSISTQLVHLMDGEIWVESAPNQGSTFHFTFHVDSNDSHERQSKPKDLSDLINLPVLIIDDNQTNLTILKETVTRWGMLPTVAHNAIEALTIIEESLKKGETFPLILSDYGMPGMDGYTLADLIKKLKGLEETKIIILSSYGQTGNPGIKRSLKIDGYLPKPVGQPELLSMIRSVLVNKTLPKSGDTLTVTSGVTELKKELRILLADDNDINQLVATNILEQAGHIVTTVVNGKEAFEQWKKEAFDLILMDIQMPEMDGYEATALIRKAEQDLGTRTAIIALTANAIKGDSDHCLEGGMDGYISKPFSRAELLSTVEAFAPSVSTVG